MLPAAALGAPSCCTGMGTGQGWDGDGTGMGRGWGFSSNPAFPHPRAQGARARLQAATNPVRSQLGAAPLGTAPSPGSAPRHGPAPRQPPRGARPVRPRTVSSWPWVTLCVRAPMRSSAPYTRSPGHSRASSSLPLAWSLRQQRKEWALGPAPGTAAPGPPLAPVPVPVVVGGEDGPEHHVLLPDDFQQLKRPQSRRK